MACNTTADRTDWPTTNFVTCTRASNWGFFWGRSGTIRFSVVVFSVFSTSSVSPLATHTKEDFSGACSYLTLSSFILSACFLPFEWLINACFSMLLCTKLRLHTKNLTLWLSVSTFQSHWINNSSMNHAELNKGYIPLSALYLDFSNM